MVEGAPHVWPENDFSQKSAFCVFHYPSYLESKKMEAALPRTPKKERNICRIPSSKKLCGKRRIERVLRHLVLENRIFHGCCLSRRSSSRSDSDAVGQDNGLVELFEKVDMFDMDDVFDILDKLYLMLFEF